MPQLIPLVAAAASTAAGLSSFATFVVVAGATLVSGAIQRSLAGDVSMPSFDMAAVGGAGLKVNSRSTQEPLKVLYGETMIGGNEVFIEPAGSDNKDLWIVMTLGEGECQGIKQADSVDQVYLGDRIYTGFGDNVSYWFYSGTSSQTYDTNLNDAIPKWTDNMRYTSYIVLKLTYDGDYFQNRPGITIILQGRKLYDFRDESTAYSNNHVLCMYDYMTNDRYGMGKDPATFDIISWTAAANYVDAKGWGLNMAITRDQAAQDVLDAMCAHFRGQLVWYDGKYYLRYADLNYESSVMTINNEHIARDSSGKAVISISEPDVFNLPDGIRVTFIDPEKNYTVDDVIVGDEVGVIKELKLLGCQDRQMALDLGVYYLEREKLSRTVQGSFRDDCLIIEPHDVITLNTTALAISDQVVRVQEASVRPDGLVDMVLGYEALELYDDEYNLETEGIYTCNLPDPKEEPPGVSNVSATEETYSYRLRTFTRLKISFDKPANYAWFDRAEVWQSFDDANWEHLFDTTSDFELPNVEEGQDYYIRLKVVNLWGKKQQDSNDYKLHKIIQGYTSEPASVSALNVIVLENGVVLYADKVADPDVELYEFRLGSSWAGGVFLAALRSPNLTLKGVKPGAHTFIVNTLSNNNEYGSTPRTASATLQDPPDSWAVQDSDTCDYNGVGTHSNTEHTTYDSDDYLMCSHTSGVLTGTYTSPIYDLGASGRYLVYVIASIVVTGAGTAWDDVMPSPDTWDNINTDSRTWNEIFQLNAGPTVKMKIQYGDTSPPANEVEKAEILCAIVTGRYFRVEIEITDPSEQVNALVENFTIKYCQ